MIPLGHQREKSNSFLELEDGEAVVVRTKELMHFKEQNEEKLKEAEQKTFLSFVI